MWSLFDYKDACRRIREAVYLSHAETSERVEEINGETDGDTIWLMRRLDDESPKASEPASARRAPLQGLSFLPSSRHNT